MPQYLTVREVADRLRVCRATVYRMIDEGRLPAVRVSSGTVRVAVENLPAIPALRNQAGKSKQEGC